MDIKFKISGMSCGHCVASITKGLNDLEGITNVEVSLEKGEAIVQVDENKITPKQIITELDELGYDAKQI